MSTNELHLDEVTYARAKRLAEERRISVEQLVSEAVERYTVAPNVEPTGTDSMIGLFADAPELMDQIVAEAYRDREQVPFRIKSE